MEEKSKRSIDCPPPAACIIIEHLFGALDVLLATDKTQRRNITHLLREFRVSKGGLRRDGGQKGQEIVKNLQWIKSAALGKHQAATPAFHFGVSDRQNLHKDLK